MLKADVVDIRLNYSHGMQRVEARIECDGRYGGVQTLYNAYNISHLLVKTPTGYLVFFNVIIRELNTSMHMIGNSMTKGTTTVEIAASSFQDARILHYFI